jgi:hypothetical protein
MNPVGMAAISASEGCCSIAFALKQVALAAQGVGMRNEMRARCKRSLQAL